MDIFASTAQPGPPPAAIARYALWIAVVLALFGWLVPSSHPRNVRACLTSSPAPPSAAYPFFDPNSCLNWPTAVTRSYDSRAAPRDTCRTASLKAAPSEPPLPLTVGTGLLVAWAVTDLAGALRVGIPRAAPQRHPRPERAVQLLPRLACRVRAVPPFPDAHYPRLRSHVFRTAGPSIVSVSLLPATGTRNEP